MKNQCETELDSLYPKDPDGPTPIAYIWARTIRCEAPNCGTEIPLIRSMWLCRKHNRKWALRPNIVRKNGMFPYVELEIFQPQSDNEVCTGTVSGSRATCPSCEGVLARDRLMSQLTEQHGGADTIFDKHGDRVGGARMLAIHTLNGETGERHYRSPTDADYKAIRLAQELIDNTIKEWENTGCPGECPVPNELINPIRPSPNARGLSAVTRYGMDTFGTLFTARQKTAMIAAMNCIKVLQTKDQQVAELLAIALGKVVDFNCSLSTWRPSEDVRNVFARQALPAVWDFVETNPNNPTYVGIERAVSHVAEVVQNTAAATLQWATVSQTDATQHPLPSESAEIWFTDPPYYDSIPYADLSDFFFVWLKRTLVGHPLLRDPFDPDNPLSPKTQECVWNQSYTYEGKPKDPVFFENTVAKAFAEGRRILSEDGVGSIVFAHKTTEGWEALISGIVRGGWTVTGSWPIATESASRINARETASLATSVHLVCRPRPVEAPIGEWSDVLRELPTRVGEWMQRLQSEGVRGADLVFACVGPALEVYSRYSAVETAEGRNVELPEYLERVWEVVGREALKQVLGTAEAQARNGAAGALEEDARLTALFLWTLQSTKEVPTNGASESDEEGEAPQTRVPGFSLPFDVARRFAQPLGIHMEDWEKRIIQTEKGLVKLRPVMDRAKELFGEDGADAMADQIESAATASAQMSLFPDEAPAVRVRTRGRGRAAARQAQQLDTPREATTLDRVHAAMLLQASGRTEALRNLLREEQDRGPDFLRLANALSALYPRGSEEKRLLDGMLLAAPR